MTDYKTSATWGEIAAQPAIWRAWAEPLSEKSAEVRAWIATESFDEIWVSGAGTSAFIGEIIARGTAKVRAVATTDFVGCPQDYLSATGKILAIQFGRSGNSSETIGMLDLLDAHRPDIARLNITCNGESALATRPAANQRVIVLPEATHDSGFAMTSSFTTMTMTALACLGVLDCRDIEKLANEAERLIFKADAMSVVRPDRAVFLGAGALTGVARESALKVLELTAGKTMTQWDSTLGYRHGPKAGVDGSTQVYVMLHPDAYVRQYDTDIAEEIRRQFPDIPVKTLGQGGDFDIKGIGDPRTDSVLFVLLAQVLAVKWSADLDLPIDDPFQGQNLSRVVSGVKLYPL